MCLAAAVGVVVGALVKVEHGAEATEEPPLTNRELLTWTEQTEPGYRTERGDPKLVQEPFSRPKDSRLGFKRRLSNKQGVMVQRVREGEPVIGRSSVQVPVLMPSKSGWES